MVRKRGGRKRALGTRAPAAVPQGRNQRWSLDFFSDTFADGRRFRILAIVDDFTRECLTLVADTSLSGHRVARELDGLIAQRGRTEGQRHRVHLDCHAALPTGSRHRLALHRAGQADAERLGRKLQRLPARRAAERDDVAEPSARPRGAGGLAERLQWRTTAHEPRRAHAERVCKEVREGP